MARIRTVKPEFFTSEDIVTMTPLARLFYVSLWCESDREGRFEWRPGTLKMRYFPGDSCKIEKLADELTERGLIRIYEVAGKKYAVIPTFKEHQVINNRESESVIPEPLTEIDACVTRESVVKAEWKEGREWKGREEEGNGREGVVPDSLERRDGGRAMRAAAKRRLQIPENFVPDENGTQKAREKGLSVAQQIDKFRDYHIGKGSVMADWQAAWRTWIGNARPETPNAQSTETTYQRTMREKWETVTGRNRKPPTEIVESVLEIES